jgi:uncharacterized phage-associated protein
MSISLFNERRAAQAAAFLLHQAGGSLPLMKLVKLLYLSERLSLQKYGEPLTGDRLVSMTHGPVLSQTLNHINGAVPSLEGGWDSWISDRAGHVVALKDPSMIRSAQQDLASLSDSDIEVLDETWMSFGHWDRWDLVKYTHDHCSEWKDPNGSSNPITYRSLFTAVGYSVDQANSLASRLSEQEQLNTAFAHF